MRYGYEVYPASSRETKYWIAESRAIIKKGIGSEKQKSAFGCGNTMEDAIADLEANEAKWIEMAEYCSLKIEEPPKKAISSGKLNWSIRGLFSLALILCMTFAGSSVIFDEKMLIGFLASLLFTAVPAEIIRKINKGFTSLGYLSPADRYQKYLEVFEKDQGTSDK